MATLLSKWTFHEKENVLKDARALKSLPSVIVETIWNSVVLTAFFNVLTKNNLQSNRNSDQYVYVKNIVSQKDFSSTDAANVQLF